MNDTRNIALNLSSSYDLNELHELDLRAEAQRWRVSLDIMKDAARMAARFLTEDYY